MSWLDYALAGIGAVAVYALGKAAMAPKDAEASDSNEPDASFPPVKTARGTVAPACLQAFKDANAKWPSRKKDSDGTLPSPEHLKQSPNSDHNAGEAFDITHDPASGCTGDAIAAAALKDPRTKYVIWNKQIFNVAQGNKDWCPYSGVNPHTHHCHVSIRPEARDDTRTWQF